VIEKDWTVHPRWSSRILWKPRKRSTRYL